MLHKSQLIIILATNLIKWHHGEGCFSFTQINVENDLTPTVGIALNSTHTDGDGDFLYMKTALDNNNILM